VIKWQFFSGLALRWIEYAGSLSRRINIRIGFDFYFCPDMDVIAENR